jgi:hypothetical protein
MVTGNSLELVAAEVVDGAGIETSAALEHRQLLAGMGQLWALHESQL